MMDSSTAVLEYAVFQTDWGWIGAARSNKGLTALILPQPSKETALSHLTGIGPKSKQNQSAFSSLARRVQDYLAGKRALFDDDIDMTAGTPFQRLVWLKTREIPYGKSRSYSWVASAVGNPRACRAVGQALGQNPLPIIVPCHRVLTATGTLGGFSGGLNVKKRLLELEGISTVKR